MAGFRTPAAAIERLRWKPSTYMAHENGQNGIRPEPAVEYAKAYNVEPGWILTGVGTGPRKTDSPVAAIPATSIGTERHTDKIRVLGMAECGPDGWALWNGEVVDMVERPANLAGVPNAYAVFITGDSMEPRYLPGEIAFIHPGKPVTPGAFVLVQMNPKNGETVPRAFLKRLVRRSGSKVVVGQIHPEKTFDLKPSEILSMHRVVGSGEA
jgi:phage repressor protein C with HTH and peptisase S24 domain